VSSRCCSASLTRYVLTIFLSSTTRHRYSRII
jgi:hypothetical protein